MTGEATPPAWEAVTDETKALVGEASAQGLVLRAVGSTGIRLHCEAAAAAMTDLERGAKDIDLVCVGHDRKGVRRLIEERGYEADRDMLVAMEGRRFLFRHAASGMEIDLFVDRLDFCHKIELAGRIDQEPLTIPLEELVLQKLQVHDLTRNDLVDTVVLLLTHPVANGGSREEIDAEFMAGLLARDWGFHRTATENLERVRRAMEGGAFPAIDEDRCLRVRERVEALRAAIDARPKSLSWRMRDRVGDRMQWWQEVSERSDAY
jgi:hypothetical protein